MKHVRELKKKIPVKHECDSDSNCSLYIWNGPQRNGKRFGTAENLRMNRDNSDERVVGISLNSEKSPADLKRLAVS